MNRAELKSIWKKEEKTAYIKGWDFSHIHGRYEEETAIKYIAANSSNEKP